MNRDPTFAAESPPVSRPTTRAEEEDLAAVLARPEGRRVLRRLLDQSGLFAPPFLADPLALAYREGGRALGLVLIQMITAAAPERLAGLLLPEEVP